MPGKAHVEMGVCSYRSLPEWQREWWDFDLSPNRVFERMKECEFGSREDKIAKYCVIPDMMGWQWPEEKYKRYKKYLVFGEKLIPHGPPNRDFGHAWTTTEHDQNNFLSLLQHFAGKFVRALGEKDKEDSAIYAGIIGHIIQDGCYPSHGLPNRSFLEYYPPPDGVSPHCHTAIDNAPVTAKICSPVSLGTSANEIAFRAWVRLENHILWCKQNLHRIMDAIYRDDNELLGGIVQPACDIGVELVSGIWYSGICLAAGKQAQGGSSNEISLVDMVPYFMHPGGKYTRIEKNGSVVNGKIEPLFTQKNVNGKSEAVKVEKGLGMTSFVSAKYIVDTSIFNRFQAKVSFSPVFREDQEERTRVKFRVELSKDINRVYSPDLNYGDTRKVGEIPLVLDRVEDVDVVLDRGCKTFIISVFPEVVEGDWCPFPHVVVDNPVLIKT